MSQDSNDGSYRGGGLFSTDYHVPYIDKKCTAVWNLYLLVHVADMLMPKTPKFWTRNKKKEATQRDSNLLCSV